MRSTPSLILAAAFAVGALVSCQKKEAPPAAATPLAPPAAGEVLQGTILEVLPAPPYAYLRLKTAQGEIWAAVPAGDYKVGAPVTVNVQIRMTKFESPSLKRTFDSVAMGTVAGAAPAAPGSALAGTPAAAPQAPDEKVAKASGQDAKTVAEVYANHDGLKDKTITLRGKVVKYNAGIMGKNWLHLRDGSGDAAAHDNDLTVTTLDTAKLGDVLTVKGAVRLNKDYGSGYVYPVVVEDAKIVK